jgi:hypothetical protein
MKIPSGILIGIMPSDGWHALFPTFFSSGTKHVPVELLGYPLDGSSV